MKSFSKLILATLAIASTSAMASSQDGTRPGILGSGAIISQSTGGTAPDAVIGTRPGGTTAPDAVIGQRGDAAAPDASAGGGRHHVGLASKIRGLFGESPEERQADRAERQDSRQAERQADRAERQDSRQANRQARRQTGANTRRRLPNGAKKRS